MAKEISQEKIDANISKVLDELNERLGSMPYNLALVDPKALKLARKNARYMKSETFKNLVENIRQDGNLSSVPFCYRDGKGVFHVLSGNHRVQAAIQAEIDNVLIFYRSDLTGDKQTAIQLSHNAIEGEDDLSILKELWESIEDLDLKIYAGLDSDLIESLDKIQFQGFSEQRIDYKSVSFLFLPEEIEKAQEVFDKIHVLFGKEDLYIFSLKKWAKFFELISEIKATCNIKNSAAAFIYLLDLAETKIQEMRPPEGGDLGDHPGEAVQIRPGRSKSKKET